ncbi:MAG: polysaccharide deacetylase family protein [Oscillospiraceae bacterium]|nr:polysaccharide deacetylase family protein [Oscillospiraceae bacterium]
MRKWILGLILCLLPFMGQNVAAEEVKYVALTFDDGPSGHYTTELLDGLKARGIKASFFLCGYRIEQFPNLTRRIAEEGHEIGTHSDAHRFFNEMSPTEICEDLSRSVEKLQSITGHRPALLRPPGGIYDMQVLRNTACADLPVILWSVDPDDWCCSNSETIAKRVTDRAKNGDVILMHDMSESSVKAAFKIIDRLQAKGFRFVTVSELAALSNTELHGGKAYSRFPMEE